MRAPPHYEIIRLIGSGCFGHVFEAIDKHTGQRVALKRMEKVGTGLSREFEILLALKGCQNIVQLLDLFYSKSSNETNCRLIQNIVFEFLPENLEDLIQSYAKTKASFEESLIKKYSYQIFRGLAEAHSKSIAHRDLKPENVLVGENGIVKICDFGSSKVIDPHGNNTPYIVSRYYRAPELLLSVTHYTTAIDIWAAGCILAEFFLKEPLFFGRSEGDQIFSMFKTIGPMSSWELREYGRRVSFDKSVLDALHGYPLPQKDFKKLFRESRDIDNLVDLFSKTFQYLPESRITADQALRHPYFDDVRMEMETVSANLEF